MKNLKKVIAIISSIVVILVLIVVFIKALSKNNLIIELDSNPTTGYDWTYEISDKNIIKLSESYKSECDGEMVGCGGVKIYKVKALKSGTLTINFKYERPWEKDENIIMATYEIKIDKNLKITQTHSGNYFNQN